SLARASPCAPCSPITAAAIAPTSFTAFVFTWASNTAALALTRRKPMAKPNASSRPPCASGPTPLTGPTPISAISHSLPGPTTTTSSGPMVAFTTSRLSAALILVQRLDLLQVPQPPVPMISNSLSNPTLGLGHPQTPHQGLNSRDSQNCK